MRDDADPLRRTLLAAGGLGLAALPAAAGAAPPPAAPVDEGSAQGGKVEFPPIAREETEPPSGGPPNPDPPDRRVGFALVGLGRLTVEQLIPALARCRHARLAALVSGDPEKLRTVAAQNGIGPEHCYSYETFDRVRDDSAVQVVYIVLPNSLHREFTERAARAGKHVLCEKPMATSAADARAMTAACAKANRLLMIAYRIQYEPNHAELRRRVRAGELGDVRAIETSIMQNQGDPEQWRHKRALAGGGSLPDIGLYCLNTVRALLGEEPVEVSASIVSDPADARFREVEDKVSFTLRFASGVVANCFSSYSAHDQRSFKVFGATGFAEMRNAFSYEGQRLSISRREGGAEAACELRVPQADQFALEMDHFAECVRAGRKPRTPGEEGVQDQVVMEAIYESARTRRPVKLPAVPGRDVFRGPEPQAG